jgi:signal transduction histidine kinase
MAVYREGPSFTSGSDLSPSPEGRKEIFPTHFFFLIQRGGKTDSLKRNLEDFHSCFSLFTYCSKYSQQYSFPNTHQVFIFQFLIIMNSSSVHTRSRTAPTRSRRRRRRLLSIGANDKTVKTLNHDACNNTDQLQSSTSLLRRRYNRSVDGDIPSSTTPKTDSQSQYHKIGGCTLSSTSTMSWPNDLGVLSCETQQLQLNRTSTSASTSTSSSNSSSNNSTPPPHQTVERVVSLTSSSCRSSTSTSSCGSSSGSWSSAAAAAAARPETVPHSESAHITFFKHAEPPQSCPQRARHLRLNLTRSSFLSDSDAPTPTIISDSEISSPCLSDTSTSPTKDLHSPVDSTPTQTSASTATAQVRESESDSQPMSMIWSLSIVHRDAIKPSAVAFVTLCAVMISMQHVVELLSSTTVAIIIALCVLILTAAVALGVTYFATRLEAREQMLQSTLQQNEAKREFVAFLCHELRNPLHAITSSLEELNEESCIPLEHMETLQSGSRTMLTIVNDMLDMSKIEAGGMHTQVECVDILGLLRQIHSSHRAWAADGDITLTLDISSDVPDTIMGDRTRIIQILNNLLSNAIKYSGSGCHVCIKARTELSTAEAGKNWLVLSVCDDGIGMTEQQAAHIFKPFAQLHSAVHKTAQSEAAVAASTTKTHASTGIGLPIVLTIIEAMQGKTSVETALGKGSSFHVHLPLILPETQDEHHPLGLAATATSGPGGCTLQSDAKTAVMQNAKHWIGDDVKPALLCVDDNAMNRKIIRRHMTRMFPHIQVIEASDGQAAIDILQSQCHPESSNCQIVCICMDVNMPIMGGIDATKQLRQSGCTIPIIAVTGNAFESDRAKYLQCGMDDVLVKPFSRSTFQDLITAYLGCYAATLLNSEK